MCGLRQATCLQLIGFRSKCPDRLLIRLSKWVDKWVHATMEIRTNRHGATSRLKTSEDRNRCVRMKVEESAVVAVYCWIIQGGKLASGAECIQQRETRRDWWLTHRHRRHQYMQFSPSSSARVVSGVWAFPLPHSVAKLSFGDEGGMRLGLLNRVRGKN